MVRNIRLNYASQAWRKYGFVDAFNPLTGLSDADVIGINVGISMLMAENQRTGFVWRMFMANPEMSGDERGGFQAVRPTRNAGNKPILQEG